MAHPEQIGPYRIEKKLGAGAMGQVYLAMDSQMFGRKVALKILSEQLSENDYARQRFQQEVETAANLNHANIVTIYAQGEHDSRPYFTMEYLQGRDLGHYAKHQDEKSLVWRIDAARQVCSALACAHSHDTQIVHRDVKPANIMVVEQSGHDVVKLLDFGIVHIEQSRMTTAHTQPGTFAYMSPEQLRGDLIDPRSDLFSLGIVLFELFTGAHPFDARNDLLISNRILDSEPDPAQPKQGRLPRAIDSLLTKLLQKDPDRRPASAAEVADALEEELHRQHQQRPSTDPGKNTTTEMQRLLDDLLAQAKRHEAAAEFEKALEVLERANVVAPDDRRIEQRIARVKHRNEAERRLREHLDKAESALDAGNVAEARDRWREAWIISPDDEEIARLEARIEQAEKARTGAREQRDSVEAHIADAKRALDDGDIDRSRALLVEALRRDTDNGQVRQLLDRVLRLEEAGVDYRAYRGLVDDAASCADRGDYAAALDRCARARKIWADEGVERVERDVHARRAARVDSLESKARTLLETARNLEAADRDRAKSIGGIERILAQLDELESRETAATLRALLKQIERPAGRAESAQGREGFEQAAEQVRRELDRLGVRIVSNPPGAAGLAPELESVADSVAALVAFDADDERTRSIQSELERLRGLVGASAGQPSSVSGGAAQSTLEDAVTEIERTCAKGPTYGRAAMEACDRAAATLGDSAIADTDAGHALRRKIEDLRRHAKRLVEKHEGREALSKAKARLREARQLADSGNKKKLIEARAILDELAPEVDRSEPLGSLRRTVDRLATDVEQRLGRQKSRGPLAWIAVAAVVVIGLGAAALSFPPVREAIFGSNFEPPSPTADLIVSQSGATSPEESAASVRVEEPTAPTDSPSPPSVEAVDGSSRDARERVASRESDPTDRPEAVESAAREQAPPQATDAAEVDKPPAPAPVVIAPSEPAAEPPPVERQELSAEIEAKPEAAIPGAQPGSLEPEPEGPLSVQQPDSLEQEPPLSDPTPVPAQLPSTEPESPTFPSTQPPAAPATIPDELEQEASQLLARGDAGLSDAEYLDLVSKLDGLIVRVDASSGTNRTSILGELKAKQERSIANWAEAARRGRASPSAMIEAIDQLTRGAAFERYREQIQETRSANRKAILRELAEWEKIWEFPNQPDRKQRALRQMIRDGQFAYEVPEGEIVYSDDCTFSFEDSLVETTVACGVDLSVDGRPMRCDASFRFSADTGNWSIHSVTQFECRSGP